MNGIWRITALALVVFSTSLYATDLGVISGWVYNDGGSKGIQKAIVYIYTSDGEILDSVFTRPNGWFEKTVYSGVYLVSAEKGNYIREFYPNEFSQSEANSISVSPGQNIIISFELDRGGWIGGSFESRDGDIGRGLVVAIKMDQPDAGWYRSVILDGSFPMNYAVCGLIPGTYKIMGQADGKGSVYYPGVEDIDDAIAIDVIRNEGVPDISFFMESVGVGYVSGRVLDAETGEGLAEVPVLAYQWRNFHEDPNLKTTSTEIDGSFLMRLTSGTYYLYAYCEDYIPGSGNVTIYYDNKLDPLYADALLIDEGNIVENIEFEFDFSNLYNLSVSGTVYDEQTGEGLGGVSIEAIDYFSGETVNSSISVSSGEFSIENLVSGSYLILFSEMNVIPFFYRDSETWQNAEVIELNTSYRGIQTEAITQDYGNLGLAISGRVTSHSGPLDGVRIYAYPVGTDQPIAYAGSNASGEYTMIRGLVPGSYTVVCDLFGFDFQAFPDTITLDLLENPFESDVDFHLEQPTTDVTEIAKLPNKLEVLANYPNPFNASTMIQVYSSYDNSRNITMTVFDVLGRKVGLKRVILNPGMNHIAWGHDDFNQTVSSGVYFYRFSDIDSTFRMVLLK
ncbi:MAG: T9SS type A sorting domain-containing protein [candidate division Zixibacteria bacterium]